MPHYPPNSSRKASDDVEVSWFPFHLIDTRDGAEKAICENFELFLSVKVLHVVPAKLSTDSYQLHLWPIPRRRPSRTTNRALKEWQRQEPELFVKRVYDQTGLDKMGIPAHRDR